MKDVRAALDPEEPDYAKAAKLGAGAVPHLEALVNSGDMMLASKAAYLASLIKDNRGADVVQTAAQSDDPAVRVAAAAAASNLSGAGASAVLEDLVTDPDAGVRKVARGAVPDRPSAKLARKIEEAGDEAEGAAEEGSMVEGGAAEGGAAVGPMPGEMPAAGTGTMPGEEAGGRMPGEQGTMPGE